jgi:hypothetical protein
MLQQDFLVAILKMTGEEEGELGRTHEEWCKTSVPMVTIELNGPEALAVEPFKWEIATARTCAQLGVDPFHDPDIRESRARTVLLLEQIASRRPSPRMAVRVREGEIELYAESETRQQISTRNMTEALRTLFGCGIPKAISRCYLLWVSGKAKISIPPHSRAARIHAGPAGAGNSWACLSSCPRTGLRERPGERTFPFVDRGSDKGSFHSWG